MKSKIRQYQKIGLEIFFGDHFYDFSKKNNGKAKLQQKNYKNNLVKKAAQKKSTTTKNFFY